MWSEVEGEGGGGNITIYRFWSNTIPKRIYNNTITEHHEGITGHMYDQRDEKLLWRWEIVLIKAERQ